MRMLKNETADVAVGMYNGEEYAFKAGEIRFLPDVVVDHLLLTRSMQLKEVDPNQFEVQQKKEEPVAIVEEPKAPQSDLKADSPVVCEVCQKDFTNSKNPAHSLSMHQRMAHKVGSEE